MDYEFARTRAKQLEDGWKAGTVNVVSDLPISPIFMEETDFYYEVVYYPDIDATFFYHVIMINSRWQHCDVRHVKGRVEWEDVEDYVDLEV